MSFGREGAICDDIEIIQISLRFEPRSRAYTRAAGSLQGGVWMRSR
jgi:hypothetical protein